MSKKGIAIVGYGGFGAFLHSAWNEMPNAHVVAVCDTNTEILPDGVKCYTDYNQMLEDPNVEIVSIATPPYTHKELALRAFAAGKHALVEKPPALTPEDTQEIAQAAERAGVRCAVNMMLRYNPVARTLRSIAENEVLGKLRRIDLRNYATQESVPEGHWFWDKEKSGGILIEHGVHFFDLATYILQDKAVSFWSTSTHRQPGMEDRVLAVVNYAEGAIGTFWHSFTRPGPLERTSMHFAFDMGEVDVFGWIPMEMKIWGWVDKTGLDKLRKLDVYFSATHLDINSARSAEFTYPADYQIAGDYTIFCTKSEQYADSLREIMGDLILSIESPDHQMQLSMREAVEAVRTAWLAANAGK